MRVCRPKAQHVTAGWTEMHKTLCVPLQRHCCAVQWPEGGIIRES